MSLPLAVYHRLDLLTDAAVAVAATRAELIGMLIADAELEPEALERSVVAYRKMTVGDVIPDEVEGGAEGPADDNVVAIRPRRPGRPARRQPG